MEKSEVEVGRKVTYIPGQGEPEKGIIKSIPEDSDEHALVVYHCAQNWENYKRYTGERTNIKYLRKGWKVPDYEKHNERRKKAEKAMKEYPDLIEIINRDSIAHAWFRQWRDSDKTIEEGFFDLAVLMMQNKDSILDKYTEHIKNKK